jgi:soluble lytic murein transglycosylase-like protein
MPSPGLVAILAGVTTASLLLASVIRPIPFAAFDATPQAASVHKAKTAGSARTGWHADSLSASRLDALTRFVTKKYRVAHPATREFIGAAHREAVRHGLDPLLVVAVIAVESSFNPVAQSSAGARGLMQVIPRFHADKIATAGDGAILDPRTNIAVGTRILKEYIRRAGSEEEGLQLYNGSAHDPSNAYANRVRAERQRLHDAARRAQSRV